MDANYVLSNVTKRFKEGMTNEEYQGRLKQIREMVCKMDKPKHRYPKSFSSYYDENSFISNILKNIRAREEDYAYSEYHIVEILRYEPQAIIKYVGDGNYWVIKKYV